MYQALDYEEYFPSSRSTTVKETDPPRETDDNVDADPMWTTERWSSRNVSAHLEESPSTVSPVIFDKMTYDSDDDPPNFSSMTESSVEMFETAYRYDNSTTESSPNENDPKETRRQEDSSTSSESATSATIELQQDVPPRRDESASMSDNSIILSNESTTGEIKNEFVSTTETTISDIVAGDDEIRDKDEDAEYEQNDSGR